MTIRDELIGKTPKIKSRLKGIAIAKQLKPGIYNRTKYKFEIVQVSAIPEGVELYARVWKDGLQFGFGKDGSVDIERFRFVNPPILVRDISGDITHEYSIPFENEKHVRQLKEDCCEAILQALEHTVSVSAFAKPSSTIFPGRRGSTITTIYSASGGDGYVGYGVASSAWSTIHDAATGNDSSSGGTLGILVCDSQAGGGGFRNYRIFTPFDTSVIGSGQQVDSATYSIKLATYSGAGHVGETGYLIQTNQSSISSLGNSNYGDVVDKHPMTDAGSVSLPASGSTDTYFDITMNATGRGWISVTGNTKLGFVYSYDALTNSGHTTNVPTGNQTHRNFYMSDQSGTSDDPKLVVDHSGAGPTGVKTWNGVTQSTSVKTYLGVALASVKSVIGVT